MTAGYQDTHFPCAEQKQLVRTSYGEEVDGKLKRRERERERERESADVLLGNEKGCQSCSSRGKKEEEQDGHDIHVLWRYHSGERFS